jgi:hypothetical protein
VRGRVRLYYRSRTPNQSAVTRAILIFGWILAFLCARAGAAEDLVLTGLANLDAIPRAFFYQPSTGRTFAIKAGQGIEGCTLLGMDMQKGRVWLQRGTNQITLEFPANGAAETGRMNSVADASVPDDTLNRDSALAKAASVKLTASGLELDSLPGTRLTANSSSALGDAGESPPTGPATADKLGISSLAMLAAKADFSMIDDPASNFLRELLLTAVPANGGHSGSAEDIACLRRLLRTQSAIEVRARIQDQLQAHTAAISPALE